jgi:hypothetical protein
MTAWELATRDSFTTTFSHGPSGCKGFKREVMKKCADWRRKIDESPERSLRNASRRPILTTG